MDGRIIEMNEKMLTEIRKASTRDFLARYELRKKLAQVDVDDVVVDTTPEADAVADRKNQPAAPGRISGRDRRGRRRDAGERAAAERRGSQLADHGHLLFPGGKPRPGRAAQSGDDRFREIGWRKAAVNHALTRNLAA